MHTRQQSVRAFTKPPGQAGCEPPPTTGTIDTGVILPLAVPCQQIVSQDSQRTLTGSNEQGDSVSRQKVTDPAASRHSQPMLRLDATSWCRARCPCHGEPPLTIREQYMLCSGRRSIESCRKCPTTHNQGLSHGHQTASDGDRAPPPAHRPRIAGRHRAATDNHTRWPPESRNRHYPARNILNDEARDENRAPQQATAGEHHGRSTHRMGMGTGKH